MAILFVNGDTGNDANPGTEALPYLTIQAAVTAAAAGDTVAVLPASSIYRERVVVDTKERLRITSLPNTAANAMARVSPATATQAANWTNEGSNVYSIVDSVSGIDDLDVDPYVIFDTQEVTYADQKIPRKEGTFADGAAIIAGLTAGTYRYLAPKLYYKRPQSDAPVNNQIRVPNHKSTDEIAAFVIKNSSYVTLENLQIEEFGRFGVFVASTSTRCIVRNLTVKNGVGEGIHFEGSKHLADRSNVSNIAPQISNSSLSTVYYMADVFPAGIGLKNATNCAVTSNSIHTFVGAGIYTYCPAELSNGTTEGLYGNNVILENRVYDQRASEVGSYLSGGLWAGSRAGDATHKDYWRGNVIYNCNDTGMVFSSTRFNVFFNNVVSKCARGYYFRNAQDNVVANTLFYRCGTMAGPNISGQQSWSALDASNAGYHLVEGLIYHDEDATDAEIEALRSNIFRKNLYYRTTGSVVFGFGETLYSASGWIEFVSPILQEKGDVDMLTSNPLFVDESTQDYRLQVTSPAVDSAAPVTTYGEAGSAFSQATQVAVRRAALDMGAYELADPPIAVGDLRLVLTRARPSSTDGPSAAFMSEAHWLTSLGGLSTTHPVIGSPWGPVDGTEIPSSGTYIQYRAVDLVNFATLPVWTQHSAGTPSINTSADATLADVSFFFVENAPLTAGGLDSTAVAAGWETSAPFNAAVASETTTPGDVTFSAPSTAGAATALPATGVSGGGTGPDLVGLLKTADAQYARLWLRRTVYPTAEFHKQARPVLRIQATSTSI